MSHHPARLILTLALLIQASFSDSVFNACDFLQGVQYDLINQLINQSINVRIGNAATGKACITLFWNRERLVALRLWLINTFIYCEKNEDVDG